MFVMVETAWDSPGIFEPYLTNYFSPDNMIMAKIAHVTIWFGLYSSRSHRCICHYPNPNSSWDVVCWIYWPYSWSWMWFTIPLPMRQRQPSYSTKQWHGSSTSPPLSIMADLTSDLHNPHRSTTLSLEWFGNQTSELLIPPPPDVHHEPSLVLPGKTFTFGH